MAGLRKMLFLLSMARTDVITPPSLFFTPQSLSISRCSSSVMAEAPGRAQIERGLAEEAPGRAGATSGSGGWIDGWIDGWMGAAGGRCCWGCLARISNCIPPDITSISSSSSMMKTS